MSFQRWTDQLKRTQVKSILRERVCKFSYPFRFFLSCTRVMSVCVCGKNKPCRCRWRRIYLDGWICRYESEFSEALSQWILLTIKGFVLIYWAVIIKMCINKQCIIWRTIKGRGVFFMSLGISLLLCYFVPISFFLYLVYFYCLNGLIVNKNMVVCLLVTSNRAHFFCCSSQFLCQMQKYLTNSVHFEQNG